MNRKNRKLISPMIIAILVCYIFMDMFLDGKIIDIPRGTREGVIIIIVGYVAIIVIIVVVTLLIELLIKKKSKKD